MSAENTFSDVFFLTFWPLVAKLLHLSLEILNLHKILAPAPDCEVYSPLARYMGKNNKAQQKDSKSNTNQSETHKQQTIKKAKKN